MRIASSETTYSTGRCGQNALDQNQAPRDNQRLDRIRERVRLIGPGHVGGGYEQDSNSAMARRLHQFVDGPVLKHEAQDEHENAKRPEDGDRRYFAIVSVADPEPSQEQHRQAVNGP